MFSYIKETAGILVCSTNHTTFSHHLLLAFEVQSSPMEHTLIKATYFTANIIIQLLKYHFTVFAAFVKEAVL